MTRGVAALCGVVGVALLGSASAQEGRMVEWPVYGGSLAAQHYSPLEQINASNVKDLADRVALVRRQFRPDAGDEERNDAADDRRRAVRDGRRDAECGCARRGQRRDVVDLAAERRRTLPHGAAPHLGPRRRLLERRRGRPPRVHRDAGLLSRVARCGDGLAEARVRRSRHRRFAARACAGRWTTSKPAPRRRRSSSATSSSSVPRAASARGRTRRPK